MKIDMNMRHVEVFRAVMVAGTVVGAAKMLNVTQPGVSRTIASLELRLGYSLFERRGRRLVPTSEGEALFREVEQLYVGIDRITQVAYDIRFHRAGSLRVAVLPALANWVVPATLAEFQSTRPHVRLFIQTLPSAQIADLVATRQFDIGVVELPMSKSGVVVSALPRAPIVVVLPQAHPLVARERISISDLAAERLVLPSPQSYLRYQIDDAFNQLSLAPNIVAETPTSPLVCALVAEGAGVGLISCWTPLPSDSRLVQRQLEGDLHSQYACLRPEGAVVMALADEFEGLLRLRMATAGCEPST